MWGQTNSLKYFKRLKIYKNSTGSCTFDPKTKEAESYNWWKFTRVIKGKLVFNDYSYSVSTSAHQWCVKSILKELKMKIHLTVRMRQSLDEFETKALEPLYEALFINQSKLSRPHSASKANERLAAIAQAKAEIKKLRKFGAKFTREQQETLKAEVEKKLQYERDRAREKRLEQAEAQKEKKAIRKQLMQAGVPDLKEVLN